MERSEDYSQENGLEETINTLRAENERLLADLKSPRGNSTEIHVYSLPRPNKEATHPNWAKHLAKYQQLLDELKYLKRRNSELETPQTHPLPSQSQDTNALLQPPSLQSNQTKDQDVSISGIESSEAREQDPSHSHTSSSLNPTPTTTRRAWRGLL